MQKTGIYRCRCGRWILPALILTAAVLGGLPADAQTAGTIGTAAPDAVGSPPDGPVNYRALKGAAQAIAKGHFATAREYLSRLNQPGQASHLAVRLQQLIEDQGRLQEQLQTARRDAFDDYVNEMTQQIQLARWREQLLNTSLADPFTHEQKKQAEDQWRRQIDEHWLDALVELRFIEDLRERGQLDTPVDETLRRQIIQHAQKIGRTLADKEQWMEAYAKVYQFLLGLDPANEQYDQESQQLLRQAVIAGIYVPDPNQDAIPWEQRRKGVSFTILSDALKRLIERYVDEPDYHAMADDALRNCLLLAETPVLNKTFPQLLDDAVRRRFVRELRALQRKSEAEPKELMGYSYLLGLLRSVQRINQESLNLPEEVLIAEFAEGTFSALDGYSYVVWPGDVSTFRKDMTGEFFGIGIEIGKVDGVLTVNSLLEGGSAEQAGLDAGDKILAVDGKSTANITLEMAVQRITGAEGTDVVLTIGRDSFRKPRDFTVTRGKIVVHTVKGLYRDPDGQWQYFVDEDRKIAYIRLTNFYGETTASLKKTLGQLQGQGLQALILDLRNNTGGFLSTAIEVTDTFISSGVIVSTRARTAEQASYDWARSENTFDAELPIAVLVNSNSASASEIVAGALQDHHRALVVGTRTFGKGNVQTIMPLNESAQLKMTIAYYYLPSDRRVHRDLHDKSSTDYGVNPDVSVELTSEQIENLRTVRRQAGILHRNGEAAGEDRSWKLFTPREIVESDPQLAMALICLQGKMVEGTLGDLDFGELVGTIPDAQAVPN
ncbi:MAG: S41 family peptidase [Sedimentisphaerales bacterium]|nr:S41 family peptidase [Sedimentisphaerales bacterium]